MRRFGLIGFPLTHSFSKKYFTEKFQKEGIQDCVYQLFEGMSPDLLGSFLAANPDIEGLNVTIPYKETVLSILHNRRELSIPACNCIRIRNGKLEGYNTDVAGFEQSLKPLLRPHHTHALVLGTGGAAKAVTWVLQKNNIAYRYVSRQKEGSLRYAELDESLMQEFTILINTTPLGTFPEVEAAPPVPFHLLNSRHLLYDLVYNPEKTRFLQEGEKRGAMIKNGYEMLVIQAEESWKIWNA
jgi:shikimate dehydrogenase